MLTPMKPMKQKIKKGTVSAAVVLMLFLPIPLRAGTAFIQQPNGSARSSADDKQAIAAFENRVKEYVKLRNQVKQKIPKLSKKSTPEEIQANKKAFVAALAAARANAKPGDLFTPDVADYIRATLKREFKGTDRKEVRKIVLDAETKIPVPLKVNYTYPDPKEFTEMPPTLLLRLPRLPKQLKYRYVGRNLLLVDTDNNLIIDYMLDALP